MRYVGLIIFVALLLVALFVIIGIWGAKTTSNAQPVVQEAKEVRRLRVLGGELARSLDKVLTDPTLIGSSEWREEANDITNRWYNP